MIPGKRLKGIIPNTPEELSIASLIRLLAAVTLIAFTLIGIEGIASEIEAPFGLGNLPIPCIPVPNSITDEIFDNISYDASDLPLDYICAELRCEVEQVISRLKETPTDSLIF